MKRPEPRAFALGISLLLLTAAPARAASPRAPAGGPPATPIWSAGSSEASSAVPGDASCPVLLFMLDAEGRLAPGRELIRSGDCGWPDVFYDDEVIPRSRKPSLGERTQFARVVLSCDHLFASEQENAELSALIPASPLQLGVPARFRIKAKLLDYLTNLALKDRGVWVFGRGRAGPSSPDPRPPVPGCKPRAWSPYPAPAEGRVSRSALVVFRRAKALEVPAYPIPDEQDAPSRPDRPADPDAPRVPDDLHFPVAR